MTRIRFLLLFGLLSLCSLPALAQSYYEFAYKNQGGKQCYGFMIYEDDDHCSMRVVEVANNQTVTASDDIKYSGEQGVDDGQKYTALVPQQQHPNAPNIIFFWNKLKESKDLELVPVFCFDLDKLDVQEPESFSEIGLADLSPDYLQQFYETSDSTYKSLIAAKKKVNRQRRMISRNLGDGTDIYRIVMAILAENGDDVDMSNLPTATEQTPSCENDDLDNSGDQDEDNDADENDDWTDGDSNNSNDNQGSTQGNNSSATTPSANGVTMHFVSVINSNVSDIGASCERDYDNLASELKGISQALGIQFKDYNVMGDYYSREAVAETLSNLRPSANDIVFFYYSGHGFRFDDQESRYPAIALTSSSYDDIREHYLLMSDIYDEVCAKNARLNIVLSDCCNTPIGIPQPEMRETGTLYGRANNNFSLSRLGNLFLQQRGSLLSTAASPGETSICDMTGGVYTLAFLRSLRKEINATNSQEVSWTTIINNTISSALQRSSDAGNLQHGIKETTMYR